LSKSFFCVKFMQKSSLVYFISCFFFDVHKFQKIVTSSAGVSSCFYQLLCSLCVYFIIWLYKPVCGILACMGTINCISWKNAVSISEDYAVMVRLLRTQLTSQLHVWIFTISMRKGKLSVETEHNSSSSVP
jgi:hypothetical protein